MNRASALRAQMREAFRILLVGFQHADRRMQGALAKGRQTRVHSDLVTALLRLVVLLFAESRRSSISPESLHALHANLQRDKVLLDERFDAWPVVCRVFNAAFRFEHESLVGTNTPLLFSQDDSVLSSAPIADDVVLQVLDALLVRDGEPAAFDELDIEHLGTAYEGLMGFDGAQSAIVYDVDEPIVDIREAAGDQRKRLGAHYTSRSITQIVTTRAIDPLLARDSSPEAILSLRICDSAMGSGAFLLEACRYLGDKLVQAWKASAAVPDFAKDDPVSCARRLVVQHCLYGVDKNPRAVLLARWSLWLLASKKGAPMTPVIDHLRSGDSLLGLMRNQVEGLELAADSPLRLRDVADGHLSTLLAVTNAKALKLELAMLPGHLRQWLCGDGAPEIERRVGDFRARHGSFHWDIEFAEVFSRGGFDVFIGNPPWVSYAGRAAQPIDDDLRAYFTKTNPAFAGYRNLQGMFVWRCATMLKPGGRLGLVLPSSMSELAGYAPTRRAHDELCECDGDLPDFGDVFDDVFQPSMALLSTRLPAERTIEAVKPWPIHRSDLDAPALALLTRLSALPKLPADLFGERGFQSMGDDIEQLHAQDGPDGRFRKGVRAGGDIEPFLRRSPRLYCDPTVFGTRFRSDTDWKSVRILIRQTARFPMATFSDGEAFRNSILAGFASAQWSANFLLAWLNSTPIRWYHYTQNRDARQGMPQVKVGHLRSLPAPASNSSVAAIDEMGRRLGERNTGITQDEQSALDECVANALELSQTERQMVLAWARALTSK